MAEKDIQIKELRNTFSKRLQMVRKMRGLSINELAKRLEGTVSNTAIEKYEKGLMFPQSSNIMVALAEVLQIPIGDLLKPFAMNIDIKKFEFRKKSKLGKKAEEAILVKIYNRVEKYFEIEDLANSRIPYVTGRSASIINDEKDARYAAISVRGQWNLGNQPIAQPILLMEENGIIIIDVDENPDLFDGSSNTVDGTPVVVLNKQGKDGNLPNEERRRLTCFHEFGHQYLRFPDEMEDKRKEDLCNVFANEMLIPSDEFIKLVGATRKSIYPVELRNIQEVYGISARALMMKARQLDILSENAFKWFCISLNKNMKLKDYIDASVYKPSRTTRFEQLVIRTLGREMISKSKAAEYLGISTAELHNRLNID